MRKFLWDQDIRKLPFQSLFKDQLGPVFSQMTCVQSNEEFTILVLRWNTYPCHMVQLQRQIFGLTLHHFLVYLHTEWIILMIMNWTVLCINSQHFFEGVEFRSGSAIFDRYAEVEFLGERYGSLDSRSEWSPFIIASWVGENGNIDPTTCITRPGVVSYYVKQNVFIDGEWKTLLMAGVAQFLEHPERHTHQSGTTEIWCKDLFEPLGPASFIPIQRIQCKFVGTVKKWKREYVLFVLPLERKIYL